MTKSYLLILFSFALLAPITGSYIYLQQQKSLIKHAVKEHLIKNASEGQLTKVVIHKAEIEQKLDWEHDHEFEFNSRMYDVVWSQTKGDSVEYTCWEDHEETALNQELKWIVARIFDQNPIQKQQNQKVISFYKNLFCENLSSFSFFGAQKSTSSISIQKLVALEGNYLLETPPPKIA